MCTSRYSICTLPYSCDYWKLCIIASSIFQMEVDHSVMLENLHIPTEVVSVSWLLQHDFTVNVWWTLTIESCQKTSRFLEKAFFSCQGLVKSRLLVLRIQGSNYISKIIINIFLDSFIPFVVLNLQKVFHLKKNQPRHFYLGWQSFNSKLTPC